MMATAKNFIGNFRTCGHVTDYNLLTFNNHNAAHGSRIVSCSCATPTESLNLQCVYPVGQFN
jgi:hypothetical protein